MDGGTDHGTDDGHGLRRTRDGASGAPTKEGEGGRRREGYVQKGTEGRKAAVSTAACARGGTNGYRAIDV